MIRNENCRFFGRRFESAQSENLNSCPALPDIQYCTIERSWLLKGFWCTSFARLWGREVRLYASLALKNVIPRVPLRDKRWFCSLTLPTCTGCSTPSRYTWREIRCVKSTRRGSGFSKRQRWGCLHVATVSGLLIVYDDLNALEKQTAFD